MYSLTGVMKQGEFSEFQGDGYLALAKQIAFNGI